MKDPIITYRGVSAHLSDLQDQRTDQLQQQQGSQLVQYRGASGPVNTQPHQKKTVEVTYRGATGSVER